MARKITNGELIHLTENVRVVHTETERSNGVFIQYDTYQGGLEVTTKSGFWNGTTWMEIFVTKEAIDA